LNPVALKPRLLQGRWTAVFHPKLQQLFHLTRVIAPEWPINKVDKAITVIVQNLGMDCQSPAKLSGSSADQF
jgi:hypothetical protein